MSSKLELTQPKDKSLEAYKEWMRAMAKALGGKDNMTEQEWLTDWQAFWQRR